MAGRLAATSATPALGAVRPTRDVVGVDGPDAVTYLQGQLSQDVDALAVGDSAWSLRPPAPGQGRRLVRVDRGWPTTTVVLDVDGGCGEALRRPARAVQAADQGRHRAARLALRRAARAAAPAPPAPTGAAVRPTRRGPASRGSTCSAAGRPPSPTACREVRRRRPTRRCGSRPGVPAHGRRAHRGAPSRPRPACVDARLASPRAASPARSWWPASTAGAATSPRHLRGLVLPDRRRRRRRAPPCSSTATRSGASPARPGSRALDAAVALGLVPARVEAAGHRARSTGATASPPPCRAARSACLPPAGADRAVEPGRRRRARITTKRVPPAVGAARPDTRPPMAATSSRTMARPRPEPTSLRHRLLLGRRRAARTRGAGRRRRCPAVVVTATRRRAASAGPPGRARPRRRPRSGELQGVLDQVGHHLAQPVGVGRATTPASGRRHVEVDAAGRGVGPEAVDHVGATSAARRPAPGRARSAGRRAGPGRAGPDQPLEPPGLAPGSPRRPAGSSGAAPSAMASA